MPRMVFLGAVVDKDTFDYEVNGQQRRQYQLYVRPDDDERSSAQIVLCEAEQYGAFAKGDVVSLPVMVTIKQPFEGRGSAKLRVMLDKAYDPAESLPAHAGS